jgi:hypothetical protein
MKNPYQTKRRSIICNADFEPPPPPFITQKISRHGKAASSDIPGSLLKSATGANKRGWGAKDNG